MRILVALGANLPNDGVSPVRTPADTVAAALSDIAASGFTLRAQSQLFATPCFPAGAGPDYVNAAAVFDAPDALSPDQVLACLHRVEAAHARARSSRWAGRTLDLDLLAIGDLVLPNLDVHAHWQTLVPADQARLTPDQLILPHPRLADRAFVLVPLAEVAADWCHPTLEKTTVQLRDALPSADLASVRPIGQG
ncbi:2-amino-4-hydroxy-6-hydroxymethyldihydropteridine diphosphokinase [Pseudorhodobacter ferrugineus]|uniref:2-amino-4-hydroxy-6- hydroxymethyldihydropteridine diphosphokinase n=1 Tax=Pseudorhodobacter ferrugineus TaxID=77008 RepID=UPI0003B54C4A|nr:2-amino-4-hydroxy-6-hydroxymethyldihydropteridine diphosphokinase [Pseudorhodobacter ferrugineus]